MDNGKDSHLNTLSAHVKAITEQFQTHLRTFSTTIVQIAPQPISILPPIFILNSFEQQKSSDDRWFSPSFYTHIGGYRMCLSVTANVWGDGKGTHVAVSVYMMRGEFDDHLQWPFKGVVGVQLINQRESGGYVEKEVVSESDKCEGTLCRVLEGERAKKGWGRSKFFCHSDLYKPEEGKEYLKNDTLKFKVSSVTVKSI